MQPILWTGGTMLLLWSIGSYWTHGLARVLVDATLAGEAGIEPVRAYVLSWGPLAPVVYFVAVTLEVIIAPIPGALLYAPGGAIFGGFVGGALSLAGNVAGASIAAGIGRTLGESWLARRMAAHHLDRLRDRLTRRALLVIVLLRVNPFTSSDLVSYAAGAIGVPASRVAFGTLIGMAPLAFAQAYLAEALFEVLPGSGLAILILGVGYVVVVAALVLRTGREK